jgi:hypothetical protein
LGPKINEQTWWNNLSSEWVYQSHGRPVDLMDQITELEKIYQAAWREEYTSYRLESTLGRWNAEYEYWRQTQAHLRAFARKLKDGTPLPPLETVLEKK